MRKRFLFSKSFMFFMVILFSGGILSFAQKAPTPEEVLGFKVGADYHLASYQQALSYFKALEQASPMIKVFELGKTSSEKPMIGAIISSKENMGKLDRFKEISRKLALAKGLTDEEARLLAAEGKAVVYIDGGLHAAECAPAQHNLQLAYDMITSDDANTRFIRENVILLLVFANPDGMDMISEWYMPNVKTPYEVSPMPWLYNKYVGHDNNRDSFMVNMVETQNIHRLQNHEWFPVVTYNHHQTAPFPARIFIPPNAEPVNPNYHPLLMRGKNLVGAGMGYAFDQEDKPGAISRISFDLWYPGYVDQIGDFFNSISILTETALHKYATPRLYTMDDIPKDYKDFTNSVFYPSPWKPGWWRLRDAVEYCLTASKAVLTTAAKYREEFLYNKYRMGKDLIARFEKEPPYAWIVPREQWDAPTAALFLNKMKLMGIDIYKAEKDFVSDGISFPAGTWVVPMNQAFANYVKTVFEEQRYSDLAKYPSLWQGVNRPEVIPGADLSLYDMVGWTLPYQMGVKAVSASAPLEVTLSLIEKAVPPPGEVESHAGYAYLISPQTNNSFIAANRILKEGGELSRSREPFSVEGKSYLPGTYIVPSGRVSGTFMDSLAKELFITIGGTNAAIPAKTFKLRTPRVALYKSWTASMDEGWTRWLFEQFEFPFTNIFDADVRAGGLGKRFDVLVIPSLSTDAIVNGHKAGTVPPQYAGGITEAGVSNIKAFIEQGGMLVLLNSGCSFGIDKFRLPVVDGLKEFRSSGRGAGAGSGAVKVKFSCPGSILRMNYDVKHPVAYGMPEEAAGYFSGSFAFTTYSSSGKTPEIIAKYPSTGSLLMSGYLTGESHLQNKASALETSLGKGKVILLGFGVQQRAQPHVTFKLLFNSLYYGAAQ